jgi:putative ABC transport system permease protein
VGERYLEPLDAALSPYNITAQPNSGELSTTLISMDSLAAMLTVMLVAVAGLGVLNTVVLDTRERVHDFGVFKALGMSPKRMISMVIMSVAGIGLVAGHGPRRRHEEPGGGHRGLPPAVLVPLVLGGLVIATAGVLLPACWAARTRTATALRTE